MRDCTMSTSCKSIILVILLVTSICLVIVYSVLKQGHVGLLTDLPGASTDQHGPHGNSLQHLHLQPWLLGISEHNATMRQDNGKTQGMRGHGNLHSQIATYSNKSVSEKAINLLMQGITDEKTNGNMLTQGTTLSNMPWTHETLNFMLMKGMAGDKPNTASNPQTSLTQTEVKRKAQGKVVLLWNKLYGNNFDMIGKNGLRRICPRSPRCTFTHNTLSVATADAVVFHMWPEDRWEFPKIRTPNQQYVFLLNESPARRDYHLEWYDHFFNLTMTYRVDSDFPFLYGNTYPRKSFVPINQPWFLAEMAVMKGKRKMAAWFVSHCRTDGKREDYVEELRKYIKVDIYGRCGTLQCWPPMSRKCYNLIRNNYRFVLAFENSVCKDYITEKVYETLACGVVPIVYGGANYKKILPPHSYINVADFASPKHLGNYLQHLMHSDAEYFKYFQWKRSFLVSTQHYEWQFSFCKLCEFLHRPIQRHKSYSTKDLQAHWGPWTCNSNYLKAMQDFWVH